MVRGHGRSSVAKQVQRQHVKRERMAQANQLAGGTAAEWQLWLEQPRQCRNVAAKRHCA